MKIATLLARIVNIAPADKPSNLGIVGAVS